MLQLVPVDRWDAHFDSSDCQTSIESLEKGQILYFPSLAFDLSSDEQAFLSSEYVDPHVKNISYFATERKLWGVQHLTDKQHIELKAMLDRFSRYATQLVHHLLPAYIPHLILARTSLRPVQICGRKTSYRKDDKRLHVDAFPSAPNQGKRILRVFSNVNPTGEDRVWRVGEPFEKVVDYFLPRIKQPIPGSAALLRFLKITKSYRTAYDHYMLHLHDLMKGDDHYQARAAQTEVRFVPQSTWIVQTDQVSHAALSGQHVLEQTFYLPVNAMQNEQFSPLRVLERKLARTLI